MGMTGKQIKERLERDLGFESNRARLLAESAASSEISTYWTRRGLGKLPTETYAAIAKAALISGLVGRQKLSDAIFKLATNDADFDHSEIVLEISALVIEHQKTINLSRNRASYVNAHLNVLEPDRSLTQVYSAHLSEKQMKEAVSESNKLLKREIDSANDFIKWLKDVHDLLSIVSKDNQKSGVDDELSDISGKKGIISRKAISTYFRQWEMFAKEKLGPAFSITVLEEDANPLTSRLNNLENGETRTWTTILSNITEARTSSVMQKRATAVSLKTTNTAAFRNVDNYDLEISGRQLKVQISQSISQDIVAQFMKALKAQFLVYSGKGLLNVSLQSNGRVLSVSLENAIKSDLSKIEEILRQLI